MEVLHQLGDVAEALDQLGRQVHRMAGGEADAPHARDGRDAADELRERAAPRIRIDVLPDEGDLAHADRGQGSDFADDLRVRPRHLAPSRVRYDAEAADVVAALHRGDEGGGLAARALRIRLRKDVFLGWDPAGLDATPL